MLIKNKRKLKHGEAKKLYIYIYMIYDIIVTEKN